jgi:Fe-S-cluster containining protein
MDKKELPVLTASNTNGPNGNANGKAVKPRLGYDCSKCPAYCCTYDWIKVTKRDIARLAKRFEISYEEAESKFTVFVKDYGPHGCRVLRHSKDDIFKSRCRFLHPTRRNCTVYEHRPEICRAFPEEKRCGYYDFLTWERKHQNDESFVPLTQ